MNIRTRSHSSFAILSFLSLAFLLLPCDAQSKPITETAKAGAYSVTLKVLPAESFVGPKAEMVRVSGAKPILLDGPHHPNHHLVAFVAEDGKPAEDARVAINYRPLSPNMGTWASLPVVRMYEAGKSAATTHYGNNVRLASGRYQVRVSVDGEGPATFRISVGQ